MRVQQINVIEIEVEDLNANEAHDKALKIIKNAPEMGEVIRTDLGHSTIEEVQGGDHVSITRLCTF